MGRYEVRAGVETAGKFRVCVCVFLPMAFFFKSVGN